MTDWQMGLEAFREGRMREAADRLQAAAQEHERTVTQAVRFQTLAFLGAALYALGQSVDAVTAFEDALLLTPPPAPPTALTLNLANAYLAAGRPQEARRALEQALQHAPGHIEARMLLQRLESRPADAPISGTRLGESPEGVKEYLRTLSFGTVTSGGYDPAQVRQALEHIERCIDSLVAQVAARDETIAGLQSEVDRAQKSEDALIENLLRAQQEADRLRQEQLTATQAETSSSQPDENAPLSAIERLFRQKP